MKNRYDGLLRTYNNDILELVPYSPFLFIVAAKEIQKLYKDGDRVIEIGTGEGDSALPILKYTNIKVDLLDISKEMLDVAKEKLKMYKDRTEYVCADAYDHLKTSEPYNIIFSGWTIHNFNKVDREKLLRSIFTNLKNGGSLVLMDKVYPVKGGMEMLKKQNGRFKKYLPANVSKAIIGHEKEDATSKYRIDEKPFLKLLKQIGFKKIEIVDRIERDVVLIARK